jgi:hypothetical protein
MVAFLADDFAHGIAAPVGIERDRGQDLVELLGREFPLLVLRAPNSIERENRYFFDLAGRSKTRFTTDCGSRNMRAIGGGFMPAK